MNQKRRKESSSSRVTHWARRKRLRRGATASDIGGNLTPRPPLLSEARGSRGRGCLKSWAAPWRRPRCRGREASAMFMGALQCVFFRSPLSVNGEGVGGGVRPRNKLLQALLEHGALEHDAPAAGETAQADVGAEA